MKITWFGHAAFLVELSDGTRLITDPYLSGSYNGDMAYKPIDEPADAVLMTHDHPDHNAAETIPGDPQIMPQPRSAVVGGARVTGIPVFHDERQGADRGQNTILLIEAEGLRLAHLGDLGHELDPETTRALKPLDVLFIPVGGYFTIDAATASRVIESLSPRVVIPMHYRTSGCRFSISGVEDFVRGKPDVERVGSSDLDITPDLLPPETRILVLEHAR